MKCEQPHPERPEVLCDKPSGCWVYHANAQHRMVWDGVPLPVTEKTSGRTGGSSSLKAQLAVMAGRAR